MEKQNIYFNNKFREDFQHDLYDLEKIMTLDDVSISLEFPRNKEEKTDWDKIREIKKERLSKHIKNFELSDWEKLLSDCHLLSRQESEEYNFRSNIEELFNILSKKDATLYAQVLEKYLEQGNMLNLYLSNRNIIETLGKERSLSLLKKYSYNLKESWLFHYYQNLDKEEVNKNNVEELLKLYKNSDVSAIPYHLSYLEKYVHLAPKIFILVTKILVERCVNENEAFHLGFEILFNKSNETLSKIEEYFDSDIELIKSCYLLCMNKSRGFDYDSTWLSNILDYDLSFFSKYLDKLFEHRDYLSVHDINQQFDILWKREDCNSVFFHCIDILFAKREGKVFFQGDILKAFLSVKQDKDHLDQKVVIFLKSYIDNFYHDEERVVFIFEYIANSSREIKKELILYFLQKNKSFELFDKLSLEPSSHTWSGSAVPYLQKDKDFYNSLLLDMTDLDLLSHKQKIEQIIKYIEKKIEREKKNDFMCKTLNLT